MILNFTNPAVRRTASHIHALSANLRDLEFGVLPDLAEAPLLEDWRLGYRLDLAIFGTVSEHPEVADGPVTTSAVYFVDEALGLARTLSRFYRLGRRAVP